MTGRGRTSTARLRPASPAEAIPAVAVILVGAALVGGLSSFGQTYLPFNAKSLCNSFGGWSMFTFLLVWTSRAKPRFSAILGVVAFEVMLVAYGTVSAWRGFFYAAPFANRYTIPGVIAGILIGTGAALIRHRGGYWMIIGIAPLTAVLIAEGSYGLLVISASTSPAYWLTEIVLGVLVLVIVAVGEYGHRLAPGPSDSSISTSTSEDAR